MSNIVLESRAGLIDIVGVLKRAYPLKSLL
jgi:hypothetical protein